MSASNQAPPKRATWMIGVALVTMAFSGYFMGLRQTSSALKVAEPVSLITPDSIRRSADETNDVPVAVSYARQDWLRDGQNADWSNSVSKLVQPPIEPVAHVVAQVDREAALLTRAGRRAYNGAPPVVPHPITQDSSAACLACHADGMVVKDRVAPKISHQPYSSCTQCHVPASGPQLPLQFASLREPLATNSFKGAPEPTRGERAWIMAPPTVPHSTSMRTDCLSCHGPLGQFALRTPHPERRSCLQCHVPNADREQRRFLDLPLVQN